MAAETVEVIGEEVTAVVMEVAQGGETAVEAACMMSSAF